MANSVPTPSKPPILSLDTLIERPVVMIDGKPCEFMHPDEMSVLDLHRQLRNAKRMQAIEALEEPSEEEIKEYERCLDTACRSILIADDAVHARLKNTHRKAIFRTFTALRLAHDLQAAAADAEEAAHGEEEGATTQTTGDN